MSRFAVIDLEMCQVHYHFENGEEALPNETIQIGAVMLDEDYQMMDHFMTYVSPEYGHINDFIHRLTGISSKDIQDAPHMKEAMKMFFDWLYGRDAVMVSWSYTDRNQIGREMEVKGIHVDGMYELMSGWIDCQAEFSRKIKDRRRFNLTDALVISDIPYVGEAHDGYTDAYNTALLFRKLRLEPDFPINEYYRKSLEPESTSLTFSLGDKLNGLKLASGGSSFTS